jgi:2-polyprenyl-3-methyl-5-hydroxy-6-metoxy-1,4-benzoquinol methylase
LLQITQKIKKSFSILDVGCGNPSFLNAIQKNLHADCTGIDFLIMDGKNNFWKFKSFKSSIANFNPNQKFDVITLWHYLEHDYNLQETIEKLFCCLNLGVD